MQVSYEHILLEDQLVRDSEKAFSEIYNRYWQRLYIFALSKLNDDAGSEDAIQTVFVELWQKRSSVKIENLSSYLHKALKNKCIDQIRQRVAGDRLATSMHNAFC